jgi:hypothetical protein
MHQGSKRTVLDDGFFSSLSQRTLPTPTEMSDNLLLAMAEWVDGRPGRTAAIDHQAYALAASIGAVDSKDVLWTVRDLSASGRLSHRCGLGAHRRI